MSLFLLSKNHAYGMLCGKMLFQLQLIFITFFSQPDVFLSEVESLRTCFEVLGLGLEAFKSSKMPCPRSGQHYFLICLKWAKVISFFSSPEVLRKICELFTRRPFFWRTLARWVLDPWPRIFFCVLGLGLKPCVFDSTSDFCVSATTLRYPLQLHSNLYFLNQLSCCHQ